MSTACTLAIGLALVVGITALNYWSIRRGKNMTPAEKKAEDDETKVW